MSGHNLRQIALHPTRDDSLLDLIFVLIHYTDCQVVALLPVAESDHNAQTIFLPAPCDKSADENESTRTDYAKICSMLQQINWTMAFTGSTSAEDYAV